MYEDRPERDTPQRILDELRTYGGESPNGLPIWRLVRAENCRIRCFGRQNHIAKGRVDAFNDESIPQEVRQASLAEFVPDRIEEGEFWIPLYRVKGWILQRWFPPTAWGKRELWEGERAQDGRTRLLAAYPQAGAYTMMPCGPWSVIPPLDQLQLAIRCYNAQQRANPANWQNYMDAIVALDKRQREISVEEYSEELEAQFRAGFSGMVRTVSGTAQKLRNRMADYSVGGINLGASEKWG